ncbi:HAD family hydrolase [Pseudohoeflea coraliihabitans]|uniref:HAD family hydrolase n=1 Tax=Pseudohoeflea coraliihabitans TaxID=2860393 RepID=A0ABS6WL71_9HYPH|nr:HAD family hydrolase [Pseudohoeflea sp. DP4N28-3]MBW3096691.1 HAD family hydrolase [Pseudohoeflea sp. DP4N28-3]
MSDILMVFDCDGVLVDSEPLAAEAYVEVYRRHGLQIGPEAVAACVGLKQGDIIAKIGADTGQHLPAAGTDDIWPVTRALFTEQLQPMPALSDFLRRLASARCVASSSSLERIHHSLAVTQLAPLLGDGIFSSSMVARGKPAPDLFEHAAREMGFAPEKCIVIEDSPFGIEGAVAAGMTAIGFTAGSHSYPGHAAALSAAGAHVVCDSFSAVERHLASIGVAAFA